MNILITHYSICDYGGLVNDTEIMTYEFKKMGHTVSNIMLTPMAYGLKIGGGGILSPRSSGYEMGIGTGLWIHHKNGWLGMDKFGFADKANIGQWKKYASGFDLIIHQNPVPTQRKEYKGIDTWLLLYKVKVPQVVISPDANFRHAYPHLYKVIKHIAGVVCTHEAGFRASAKLPAKRILLPGPHIIDKADVKTRIESKRRRGICSVQNFKPIKHMEDIINAIPHLKKSTRKIVAGGGIEYCYMTSVDKVKPKYVAADGKSIWMHALESGMEFKGYISNEVRDKIMSSVTAHVDCSWSRKYSALGPHFNRTFIEAMKNGCVPMCTDLGMDDSEVFKPGVHYVRLPSNGDPVELAATIEEALGNKRLIESIQVNNLKCIHKFNSRFVCEQIIKLGTTGDAEGLLGEARMGSEDKEIKKASEKMMKFFKGGHYE